MREWLSITGLYRYDPTILDGIILPEGIDSDTLKMAIIDELAEIPLVYPDLNYMKASIPIWSKTLQYKWKNLYESTTFDYDPIENYNRFEEYSDTEDSSHNENESHEAEGSTTIDSNVTSTSTRSQGAYNSADLVNTEKISDIADNMQTNDSKASNTTNRDGTGKRTLIHTAHMHGNIGVTTTTQMLKEQREIVNYSVYSVIVDDFKEKYCVMVY